LSGVANGWKPLEIAAHVVAAGLMLFALPHLFDASSGTDRRCFHKSGPGLIALEGATFYAISAIRDQSARTAYISAPCSAPRRGKA